MRKTPATVLSVSPAEEVHFSLQEIFNHSIWKLHKTHSLPAALAIIRAQTIPVVLCETDLLPGTWQGFVGPDRARSRSPGRHREFPAGG
jgi:hypothetical protein